MITASPERDFALQIVKQLREHGYQALWAGGCVRDELLGIIPKDYDVATNALPKQVQSVFGKRKTIAVGAAFGVITVVGRQSQGQVEIATFRCDSEYSDGRHPDSVTFSTAEEDAQRRDFTVNGLFYDPVKEEIIDFVGGQEDLRQKSLRAIGDPQDRFHEDKLRMLRAIRFATTYSLQIERETFAAIRQNANKLDVVSQERIATELRRLLAHPNRMLGVELLKDSDLLNQIFQSSIFDLAQIDRGLRILERLETDRFETALSAILWALSRETIGLDPRQQDKMLKVWGNEFKLSNAENELIRFLRINVEVVRCANEESWPDTQPALIHQEVDELLRLSRAIAAVEEDAAAQAKMAEGIRFCETKLKLPIEQLDPEPLVSGDDLIAKGIQPGPLFKEILEQIRRRQLREEITDRESAIEFATCFQDGQ